MRRLPPSQQAGLMDCSEKLDMLPSIGADHVIDYIQADFTKSGETYDVFIDVVGKSSFSGNRHIIGINNNISRMFTGRRFLHDLHASAWCFLQWIKAVILQQKHAACAKAGLFANDRNMI